MKIAILGAGAFGTALGGILAEKGMDIDYYDSKLERERLSDVLADAEMMMLAVPSKVVPYITPHLPKDKPLIVATKGLLSDKIFREMADVMVLSGPGFADDIKAGKRTLLTATDYRVMEMFAVPFIEFDYTDDVKGVLMCGALKNVYAIYAGMQDLKRSSEPWREFVDEATAEMEVLLQANGANPETAGLACGVGDLMLTCGLPSRNYEYGQMWRESPGAAPTKTVEGLTTLTKIMRGEIIVPEGLSLLTALITEVEAHGVK